MNFLKTDIGKTTLLAWTWIKLYLRAYWETAGILKIKNVLTNSMYHVTKFAVLLKVAIDSFLFLFGATPPPLPGIRAFSFTRFLNHTKWRTTVGGTPLDEWSVRRRDPYLTKHNTQNRQTSMYPMGFEPTISAGERPQTYAFNGAATGID